MPLFSIKNKKSNKVNKIVICKHAIRVINIRICDEGNSTQLQDSQVLLDSRIYRRTHFCFAQKRKIVTKIGRGSECIEEKVPSFNFCVTFLPFFLSPPLQFTLLFYLWGYLREQFSFLFSSPCHFPSLYPQSIQSLSIPVHQGTEIDT